jgi:hypothetical protein
MAPQLMKMTELMAEVMKEVDKKFYERDYKLEALKQAFQGHNREIGELFDFLKDLKEKMLLAIKLIENQLDDDNEEEDIETCPECHSTEVQMEIMKFVDQLRTKKKS